jgi:hypothetical protein
MRRLPLLAKEFFLVYYSLISFFAHDALYIRGTITFIFARKNDHLTVVILTKFKNISFCQSQSTSVVFYFSHVSSMIIHI